MLLISDFMLPSMRVLSADDHTELNTSMKKVFLGNVQLCRMYNDLHILQREINKELNKVGEDYEYC